MFKLENLAKDVREKIYTIEFIPEEEHIMGLVWLKDEWEFDWDGSHVECFSSRQDLINMVRFETRKINK